MGPVTACAWYLERMTSIVARDHRFVLQPPSQTTYATLSKLCCFDTTSSSGDTKSRGRVNAPRTSLYSCLSSSGKATSGEGSSGRGPPSGRATSAAEGSRGCCGLPSGQRRIVGGRSRPPLLLRAGVIGACPGPQRIADISRTRTGQHWRLPLAGRAGAEVARVLGGGVVPGSLTLIGGDPGVGKVGLPPLPPPLTWHRVLGGC